MKTIDYQIHKEIPVVAECDVLVVGGGPGGTGAAVMAAECGAKVVLAEQHGCMGGTATFAEITPMMRNHYAEDGNITHAETMDRPVYPRMMKQMQSYLSDFDFSEPGANWSNRKLVVSKSLISLAMEDLCLEAGVKLFYHFTLVDVVRKGRRIEYAVFRTRSGYAAIQAKTFVDASGNADLAAFAGCGFEYGDREHGLCQPMTLCFKLSGVDVKNINWDEVQKLYKEARERGEIDCKRNDILHMRYDFEPGVVHFNTTRVLGRSAVDGLEFSEAEIEGRRQLRQFIKWIRKDVPAFKHSHLMSMGAEIGVRESRRVKGRAYLTEEDFNNRSKFPDAIARCNYPIDIHSVNGGSTRMVWMGCNEYYEIPYGCIVPEDCDNLLVGGRPISVSHELHSSSRVMPPACSVGQAAGAGCALAVKRGCDPSALDGRDVRSLLVEHGAWL